MLATFNQTTPTGFPLRVAFQGAPAHPAETVQIETPWLSGAATEEIFAAVKPLGAQNDVRLFRCGRLLLGIASEPFAPPRLAAGTRSLYRRILEVTRGKHLYRIWNYVPEINAHTNGLENYRAFCQGRSVAFEETLGGQFQPHLPAASAVGSRGTHLKVIFVAGESVPVHFENPEQVPAYHYPLEHGPRPPSFARATVARDQAATWTFISGTSAIKGHETIAPGSFGAQLDCTLDNLRLMSRKSGLGDDLGAGRATQRQFKIYLRHADDLPVARERLERTLFRPDDVATYLQAEICRAALSIEIEATVVDSARAQSQGGVASAVTTQKKPLMHADGR